MSFFRNFTLAINQYLTEGQKIAFKDSKSNSSCMETEEINEKIINLDHSNVNTRAFQSANDSELESRISECKVEGSAQEKSSSNTFQRLRDEAQINAGTYTECSPIKSITSITLQNLNQNYQNDEKLFQKRINNTSADQKEKSHLQKQYNVIRKKIKKQTDEDFQVQQKSVKEKKGKKSKRSKYFDPKPYVMRKIKHYIRTICHEKTSQDHRLTEDYFRKNINEDYYRTVLFSDYNSEIDKSVMFEQIRSQWLTNIPTTTASQNFSVQERKLTLQQIRRVELLYTFDTKTIQKLMWCLLQQISDQCQAIKSFKKQNYKQIAQILLTVLKQKYEKPEQIVEQYNQYWNKLKTQLRHKNTIKYDRFILQKIRNQYFEPQFSQLL